MKGTEYAVEYWIEGDRTFCFYHTTAPEAAPDGLHRYFRAYSSLSGEELFLGDYIHLWNCYGGMGPTDGGVIEGLRRTFPWCEISIIDSPKQPKY